MGLDMFLTRRLSKYSMTPDQLSKLKADYPNINAIEEEVYTWRKANAIHKWFCDTVNNGDEINCKACYVGKEQLGELADKIDDILKNHTKAEKLLPTHAGFFFGDYEYDEWYFKELEDTLPVLKRVLLDNGKWDYYYDAWW